MSELKESQVPDASMSAAFTSQLMQNYRVGAPISGGTQIATAPNNTTGEAEVFSIGTTGHVFKIYPDPKSDTGWNTVDLDFPGEARFVAAAGEPDGVIKVYAADADSRIFTQGKFTSLVTGTGPGNAGEIIGLGSDGFARLVPGQGGNSPLPPDLRLPGQSKRLAQITTGVGNSNSLLVIGLDEDGNPHVVAAQDGSGNWQSGALLPSQGQWATLVTGSGNDNFLQVIAVGLDHHAYVVAWQDSSTGVWTGGFPLPDQSEWGQLVTGNGNNHNLQVIGLGLGGCAHLVAWQDNNNGSWAGGFPVGCADVRLTDLATGNDRNGLLYVFGLGADGFAYLAASQDSGGVWSAGFQLPDQKTKLTSIAISGAPDGSLEVIGLGKDGQAYLVSRQDLSGVWHPGVSLPIAETPLTSILIENCSNATLRVIGLGENGDVYVVASQDINLSWSSGEKFPNAWQQLPDLNAIATGLGVGYDLENVPFLVASRRFTPKSPSRASESFAMLVNGEWSGFGTGSSAIFGWAPAMVPFSGDDMKTHAGVYSSLTDILTIGDRGILGAVLGGGEFGPEIMGSYSKVTAANCAQGFSGVFALGQNDLGVYYLAPQGPSPNPKLSAMKLSRDTAILSIAAGSDPEGLLEVFAISTDGFLYHTRQNPASPTGWDIFLQLNLDLMFSQLVAGKNPAGFSDVFAVTEANGLYHIWQDPVSSDWHFDEIDLPKGKVEEFSSYNVLMTVFDTSGAPAPNSPVTIFSDDPVRLDINGASVFVEASHPWTGTSNAAGQVTIAMKIDSLGVRCLKAWTPFMAASDRFNIDPSGPVHETLASVDSQTLMSAMWTDDQGIQQPLLSTEGEKAAPDIAKAVTMGFSIVKDHGSMPTSSRFLHPQRNDSRVGQYIAGNGSTQAATQPISVADQCWQVDFRSGQPVFRMLDRAEFDALAEEYRALPTAASFFGFDVDWGDVFDAIRDGIASITDYLVDGVTVTFNLLIAGFSHAFTAAIEAVEQAFDLAEEIFKRVQTGFNELFRWLGFIFNWDDIVRTHEVITYSVDTVAQFTQTAVLTLKTQLNEMFDTLNGEVKMAFDGAINRLGPTNGLLSLQQTSAPSLPEQAMIMEHNIVWNGFMNNVDNISSLPGGSGLLAVSPEAREAVESLIAMLDQNASQFQSSTAFAKARDYLAGAATNPDHFVQNALSGLLSVVEGVVCWGLDKTRDVLIAILDAAAHLIDTIIGSREGNGLLKETWEIPFVSDLYLKYAGAPLSALDLSALIVAVPVTAVYKVLRDVAPFPDEQSVINFKSAFTVQSLLEASGLGPSSPAPVQPSAAAVSETELATARQDWALAFAIGEWVADAAHFALTAGLDAAKLLSDVGQARSFERVLSWAALPTVIIRQFAKIPWICSNVPPSLKNPEGFKNMVWIYGWLPFLVDGIFFLSEDDSAKPQPPVMNQRTARPTGIFGPLSNTTLGALDGLLRLRVFLDSKEPTFKDTALDVLRWVPDSLAFMRLISKPPLNVPLLVLIAVDSLCAFGTLVLNFLKILDKAGVTIPSTTAPGLARARSM